MISDVFEKYLFNLQYQIVDPTQGQADGVISGSITELTATSEQTVMVDYPQEVTEPVYQDVTYQGRHGVRTVTQQVGTQTTMVDNPVPETETLPARVGLNARMVSAKNGELLWSGSGSADGMDISSAAEAAASKVIDALQKELANHKSASSK
jgi:TolB-like protein